jgi:hypothetical protein
MRSAAESVQARAHASARREGVLRGVAVAALLAALIAALWPQARDGSAGAAVSLRFDAAPSALLRDSLAALARAGRLVTWSGDVASVAAMAEVVREPSPRWRIAVVGDSPVQLRDSLGPIDSLTSGIVTTQPTLGPALAVERGSVAAVRPEERVQTRGVLVLGRVGWESRFVMTALEEAGWRVDARLPLGRGREVRQGNPTLDLARHDVVIVLDSASARRDAAILARYADAGGGVILAGEAARAEPAALRGIAAARVAGIEPPETRSFEGHEPTHALPLFALTALRADAVLLDDREGTPAVVARRVGRGRLIQLGYTDTWRWRMEGEGRSVEEHRAYWSRLVGLAARGIVERGPQRIPQLGEPAAAHRTEVDPVNAQPRAALTQSLGAASAESPRSQHAAPPFPVWLGPIILLALLSEWGSRRTRGLP